MDHDQENARRGAAKATAVQAGQPVSNAFGSERRREPDEAPPGFFQGGLWI